MKTLNKKALVLLSVLMLSVGALSACGTASTSEDKDSKSSQGKAKDAKDQKTPTASALSPADAPAAKHNQVADFAKLFSVTGTNYGIVDNGISVRLSGESAKYTPLENKLGVVVYKVGEGQACPSDSIVFPVFSTGVLTSKPQPEVQNLSEGLGYGIYLKSAGQGLKDVLTDVTVGTEMLASLPLNLNPDHFALPQDAPSYLPQLYNFHVKHCLSYGKYEQAMADLKKAKQTGETLKGVKVTGKPGEAPEIEIDSTQVPAGKQVALAYEGTGPEVGYNDAFVFHNTKVMRKYLPNINASIENKDSSTYKMPGAMPTLFVPGKDLLFTGDDKIKLGSRQVVVQRFGETILVWVNDLVYKF